MCESAIHYPWWSDDLGGYVSDEQQEGWGYLASLIEHLGTPAFPNPCHPRDRDLPDPLQTGERLAVAVGWLVGDQMTGRAHGRNNRKRGLVTKLDLE